MRELTVRRPLQFVLLGLALLYALLLLFAPIVAIVQGAFSQGVETLIKALSLPDVALAFRTTFTLTLASAAINTLAGIVIAWVLVRHQFPGKRLFDALVDAPFVFSPVIVGYALILLFGRNGWLSTPTFQLAFSWPAMLIATVFVSLPFVTRELQPILAALTAEQEEAAYTLGSSRWATFRRVIFPQIWRGVLYGVVLTTARSFGEFGAVVVAGGGIERVTESATVYVFRALNDRNPVGAYGVSVLLGLLSVSILVAMSLVRRSRAGE